MTEPTPAGEPPKKSNLAQRLITAAVLAPIIVWLLFWDEKLGFLFVVLGALSLCTDELASMVAPNSRSERIALFVGAWFVFGTVVLFSGAPFFAPLIVAMLVVLVFCGFSRALFRNEPVEGADRAMAWSVAGPLYIGGLLSTITLLHFRENGGGWVLLSMFFAFLSDTGAYFAGRFLGKHKLYEKISPKKTIEGSVGGVLGAVAGAVLAHFWFLPELALVPGILLAVVASFVGQCGDLFASLIKRSAGAKDSGNVLPGHGGMLDRIDALLFTAPITWAYTEWITGTAAYVPFH